MWICSHCGANVEPSFEVCWRCGTSYQGEVDPDFVTADESPPIDDPTASLPLDPGKISEGELAEPLLDLASCFETNHLTEAKFVADELNAGGIAATLQNIYNQSFPGVGYARYPCRVVVRREDLPRAKVWVDDFRERRKAREAQPG